MSDFPTLEKIVAVHRWAGRREQFWDARCTGCHWRGDIRGTGKTCIALHAEHVQAEWVKSRTIETVEQLDALPVNSVVLSTRKQFAWQKVEPRERITAGGWMCKDPIYPGIYSAELLISALGVDRLLWHPGVDA